MTDQSKIKQTGVAHVEARNPYIEHGADSAERLFMKFAKGDYFVTIGKDKRPIPAGKRFVVNMHSYAIGYIKWPVGGGRPDRRMGRVVDGFVPDRNLLPDNDCDFWGLNDRGAPDDPYKASAEVMVADPETGEVLVFTSSSMGGLKALKRLCYAYGCEMAKHPRQWPVVSLEVGGYEHKTRGWVHVPVFKIVDWIDWDASNLGVLTSPAPTPTPTPTAAARDVAEPPSYEAGDPGFDGEDDSRF